MIDRDLQLKKIIANNIKHLLKQNNWSQLKLSEKAGISKSTISDYLNLKTLINPGNVQKMSIAFNVSKEQIDPSFSSDYYSLANNILPISTQKIPLLGEVAAGVPIFADEDFESYVEAGAGVKADFCLKVKGDSMINAKISDGDIVFVKKQSTVENGEVAVVLINDEATLKRFYRTENEVMLVAENQAYMPMTFRNEEIDNIRILGKAVACQTDIK